MCVCVCVCVCVYIYDVDKGLCSEEWNAEVYSLEHTITLQELPCAYVDPYNEKQPEGHTGDAVISYGMEDCGEPCLSPK